MEKILAYYFTAGTISAQNLKKLTVQLIFQLQSFPQFVTKVPLTKVMLLNCVQIISISQPKSKKSNCENNCCAYHVFFKDHSCKKLIEEVPVEIVPQIPDIQQDLQIPPVPSELSTEHSKKMKKFIELKIVNS